MSTSYRNHLNTFFQNSFKDEDHIWLNTEQNLSPLAKKTRLILTWVVEAVFFIPNIIFYPVLCEIIDSINTLYRNPLKDNDFQALRKTLQDLHENDAESFDHFVHHLREQPISFFKSIESKTLITELLSLSDAHLQFEKIADYLSNDENNGKKMMQYIQTNLSSNMTNKNNRIDTLRMRGRQEINRLREQSYSNALNKADALEKSMWADDFGFDERTFRKVAAKHRLPTFFNGYKTMPDTHTHIFCTPHPLKISIFAAETPLKNLSPKKKRIKYRCVEEPLQKNSIQFDQN